MNAQFWRNKSVFVTGHTGFKGSWLSLWLQNLGANVCGYSLAPPTQPNLFHLAQVDEGMESLSGDILDLDRLERALCDHQPEIVFHLAAQSLVLRSYEDPVGTYATNVAGTAHVLEAVRKSTSTRCVVIVTSDKCYENRGDLRPHRETDPLGGADPYSSSKAAAELVTASFRRSFFSKPGQPMETGIASARAGNVIGGGDWAEDRLIPDAMRSVTEGAPLKVRNPASVRPWQHVLDTLSGYLALAESLWRDPARFSEGWNFGPDHEEPASVRDVLERLRQRWGEDLRWIADPEPGQLETRYLRLDCTKAREKLGWNPRWDLDSALEATVQWYKAYQSRQDLRMVAEAQIRSHQAAQALPELSRK